MMANVNEILEKMTGCDEWLILADGADIHLQPSEPNGAQTHVEVYSKRKLESMSDYYETGGYGVSLYDRVPVEVVEEEIDRRGGVLNKRCA